MVAPAAVVTMLPSWAKVREDGRAVVLALHVQPGARASGPAGRHGEALKLRIAAPAANNAANAAVQEFLRHALGVPRTAVRIAHGLRSRRKLIEIEVAPQAAVARLLAWDRGEAA